MQYSDRGKDSHTLIPLNRIPIFVSEMAQLSFDHLLKLSFSFHMHRKTGEILRVLDRGSAINHVLEVSCKLYSA
jgi:ABC-type transport system involved in Fe-S cluster assembly fused permease/ATPase subunit